MNQNVEDIAFQQNKPVDVQKFMRAQNYDPRTNYHQGDDVYMAVSSKIAYEYRDNLRKDPKTANQKTNKLIQSRMHGHSLMEGYSNENQVVIRRPDDSIIFAVRGTDPFNPSDIANDAYITFAAMDAMPVSRLTEVEKVFKKLPKGKQVTLTGHSLGADIARRLGEKYNTRSVTFSTPAVYPSTPGPSHNRTYLTNTLDFVSSGNHIFNFKDSLEVLPQSSTVFLTASHDISNFLPPESMYPLKHHITPHPKSIEYPLKPSKKVFTNLPFKQDTTPLKNPYIQTDTFSNYPSPFYAKKKKKKSTLTVNE
jgi:hypothetical protein